MPVNNDVTLRPAVAADAELVYRVTEACMRGYAEQMWGRWDEARARSAFDPATHQIIQYQGVDVGVLEHISDPERITVESLYVIPGYQNRGVGANVLQALMGDAAAADKPIDLTVLVVNPARRFYERLGFSVVQSTSERHHMVWHPRDQDVPKNPK